MVESPITPPTFFKLHNCPVGDGQSGTLQAFTTDSDHGLGPRTCRGRLVGIVKEYRRDEGREKEMTR